MSLRHFAPLLCAAALPAAAQLPSFPGAEGFGAAAKGGRGGDVYTVTNLNSSGAGSLADAIATVPAAGRTIVFAVSGYIPISKLRLTKPNVTIAGQTAPGDGIGLINSSFRISSEDVVVRHLRVRHRKSGNAGDCINLDSGAINVMLDSLSVQFSTDENMSSFSSPPDLMTFQWSNNAWGLESHSAGGLWDQNRVTTHHTLWAHNHTRNPKVRTNVLDWVNNVTFDWDIGFIMGDSETPADWKANVRNNYFLCPPGNLRSRALEKANIDRNGGRNFSLYLSNNRIDNDGDGLLNGIDQGYGIASGSYITLAAPLAAPAVAMDDPLLAFKKVVSKAGALRLEIDPARPLRDEVDTRLFQNVLTQTRNHITRESDLAGISNGGLGTLKSSPAPADTDLDGMPDVWELALGWNPGVQDHNTVLGTTGYFPAGTPAGYTRLEEYLHFRAIPHGFVGKNTAGAATSATVDLRKFTAGFVKTPVFTLTNVIGGSASQTGPGGALVVFTPTLNFSGRAKFDFTVTDADGSAWTQTCALLVSVAGIPRDLTWQGGASGNAWDESTANWLHGGNPATFGAGDFATFDDSTAATTVALAGNLLPGGVTVAADRDYTFSGGGALGGTGGIVKNGAGTLTVANSGNNTFAGGILLQQGRLQVASGGLGSGRVTLQGGELVSAYGATTNFNLAGGVAVPAGVAGTVKMSPRMAIGGASGAGTLNLEIPATNFIYASLNNGFSGFSGTLNLKGTVPNALVTAQFNGGGFDGALGNAIVQLENVKLVGRHNSGGNTLTLGALRGDAASVIGGSGYAGPMTLVAGGLGHDDTFAGAITDGVSPTVFTKTGSGKLTLSGASTHTGATSVQGGTLHLPGSLGATALGMAAGTTLSGGGSVGGTVSLAAGAAVSPGNLPGQPGTLTVGGLTLASPKLVFDLSSSPAGQNDRIQISGGGPLAMSGVQNFQFNLTDGVLGQGVYDLIATSGAGSASGVTLVSNLPASGSRQTFALSRNASGSSPGFVKLTVGGSPAASLTWTGASTAWDFTTAGAWTGAADSKFYNFDAVRFTDSAASGNVVIAGPGVAPRSLTVDNSALAYTISGAGITGATALVKEGAGTLVLAPAIISTQSTVTAGSATVTPASTAGILLGMTVSGTGIPAGTTVVAVGGGNVTLSQSATAGGSVQLTFASANTHTGGTFIHGGTIVLANDHANTVAFGSGPVVFGNGGTLAMFDNTGGYNTSAWDMVVPAGVTGTLLADSRVDLTGRLTGGGTLAMRVPWIRTHVFGDWSGFSGTLRLTTDADGGEFRYGTNYRYAGFPNAAVELPDKMAFQFIGIVDGTTGTTVEVGSLAGAPGSRLRGGPTPGRPFTYRIGGRGTDAEFAGTFEEQAAGTITSYAKTGAGTWTLAGGGSWNGGLAVEQGTLRISGNPACTGATEVSPGATLAMAGGGFETEAISLAAGSALEGHGTLLADVNCEGTFTARGYATGTPGTLTLHGSAYFGDPAVLRLHPGDRLAVHGDLALAGNFKLAPAFSFGRHAVITHTGTVDLGPVTFDRPDAHLSTSVAGEIAIVIDDSDEDGLPDSWEKLHFQSLVHGPADDPDGDGSSNAAELLAGTLPADGASRFHAVLTARNGALTLAWPSVPGKAYLIESSASPAGPWTGAVLVPAAPAPAAVTTAPVATAGTARFFRVKLSP